MDTIQGSRRGLDTQFVPVESRNLCKLVDEVMTSRYNGIVDNNGLREQCVDYRNHVLYQNIDDIAVYLGTNKHWLSKSVAGFIAYDILRYYVKCFASTPFYLYMNRARLAMGLGPMCKWMEHSVFYRLECREGILYARGTIPLAKFLQDTKIEGELQMFGAFASVVGDVAGKAYLGYKANATMDAVTSKVEQVSDKMIETLDLFKNKLSKSVSSGINIYEFLKDLIYAVVNYSMASPEYRIKSFLFNFVAVISKYIPTEGFTSLLASYFSPSDVEKVDTVLTGELQSGVLSVCNDAVLKGISVIFMTILSVIGLGSLPGKTDFESMFNRFGALGRSCQGLKSLLEVFNNVFEYVYTWFKKEVLHISTQSEMDKMIENYDNWMTSVADCVARNTVTEERQSDLISSSTDEIMHIESLYKEGLEISKRIAEAKLPREMTFSFLQHMRLITGLFTKCDASGAFGNKPRVRPLVVWLYGESQVGKSGMAWPLAIEMNNVFMKSEDESAQFARNIYFRNVEQEFWDNYSGQNVVCYDDFGQMRDSQQKPNAEFMEIIRSCNIAPYPLHMAHLEDKRRTKFTSKVLLLTSNVLDQKVDSLTFPDAFRARIDVCARVSNKKEWTKVEHSKTTQKEVLRLDKDRVFRETGNPIHTDVYEITLVDAQTGRDVSDPMSYNDFRDLCVEKLRSEYEKSVTLNDYLSDYARRTFSNTHPAADEVDVVPVTETEDLSWHECQESQLSGSMSAPSVESPLKEDKFDLTPVWDEQNVLANMYSAGGILPDRDFSGNYNGKTKVIGKLQSGDGEEDVLMSLDAVAVACPAIEDITDSNISSIYDRLKRFGKLEFYTMSNVKKMICYDAMAATLDMFKMQLQCSRITKVITYPWMDQLSSVRFSALEYLRKWKNKMLELVQDHPVIVFGSLFGLMLSVKVWSILPLCSQKKEEKKHSIRSVGRGVLVADCIPDVDCIIYSHAQCEDSGALGQAIEEAYLNGEDFVLIEMTNFSQDRIAYYKTCAQAIVDSNLDIIIVLFESQGLGDPTLVKKFESAVCRSHKLLEVAHSGDSLTRARRVKRVLEGAASVDSPLASEVAHSGDSLTHSKKSQRVLEQAASIIPELAHSGDDVTRNKRNIKVLETTLPETKIPDEPPLEGDMEVWTDQTCQMLISNRILKNQYLMHLISGKEVIGFINVMFVRGSVAITAAHVRYVLKQADRVKLYSAFGIEFDVPVSDIQVLDMVNGLGKRKECIALAFPRFVTGHSDLVKHFADSESMQKGSRFDAVLPALRGICGKPTPIIMTTTVVAQDEDVEFTDSKSKLVTVIRAALDYEAPTTGGDCGSPLMVNDTRVLKKICGVHVAGYGRGRCLAEPVTAEDLRRVLLKVDPRLQVRLDDDLFPNSKLLPLELEVDVPLDVEGLYREYIPCMRFMPMNVTTRVPALPTHSAIIPSLIHGMVTDATTKPAYLRNTLIEGEVVQIRNKNLQKAALNTPYISSKLIKEAVHSYEKKLFANKQMRFCRVFTLEESIIGLEGEPYCGPIARRTSPGYPWVLKRKGGSIGKQQWLGSDEDYVLDDELRIACEKRVAWAKAGLRTPTQWVDTLKDERRPVEKVNAGKTRVFAAGPMDYTLVFRQYFLGFIANVMENRIANEQSLGTNPFSMDWELTARLLSSKGDAVIAGDFSTFDGTLNSCIIAECCDIINRWYDDGRENALIREVLFKEVYNSIHLNPESRITYMWTHSQPSGCPITTVLNSLYNSISMRIVYSLCAESARIKGIDCDRTTKDFDKDVAMVSYGDDNCVNISNNITDWFNQNTITEAYARIGMVYTDESKSGGEMAPFRRLDQIAYLKRGFVYDDERRYWRAPLELATVLEMANWCRTSLDPSEATHENVCCAIRELSLHGEAVFDEWAPRLRDAYYKVCGHFPDDATYDEYYQTRYFTMLGVSPPGVPFASHDRPCKSSVSEHLGCQQHSE